MVGIYVILIFLGICIVFILYSQYKRKNGDDTDTVSTNKDRPNDCCGAHEVCEKEKLTGSSPFIEYYDDEELDIYAGRPANKYNEEEIRQFCEVFYTLQEKDVSGWLKSLQNRGIELPEELHDEALLIMREQK
jgi:hypothetical protein